MLLEPDRWRLLVVSSALLTLAGVIASRDRTECLSTKLVDPPLASSEPEPPAASNGHFVIHQLAPMTALEACKYRCDVIACVETGSIHYRIDASARERERMACHRGCTDTGEWNRLIRE